ncbi:MULTISPECIES: hypothetical protein [Enterobacter cloacae complex]|nr:MULTISPECIES: hypothetical protein [Enterobacter cloacae complex]
MASCGSKKRDKQVMTVKDKVFFFWGGMDILAIILYCVNSVLKGRLPFVSDALSFTDLWSAHSALVPGILVLLLFALDLGLLLSFVLSAIFFFKRKRCAVKFALFQEVFRLISFRCSVSFFPLLADITGISNVWVTLVLFMISETLKLYSLIYYKYTKKVACA